MILMRKTTRYLGKIKINLEFHAQNLCLQNVSFQLFDLDGYQNHFNIEFRI